MEDQFLELIHQHIEENIDNENFSVSDLAQKVGLSRSALHRKLIRYSGQSARDLILETRLNRARKLLENDVATAAEIAYQVGFSYPSYFNKVFKERFGVSPGDLRKQHSSNNKQAGPFHPRKLRESRYLLKAALALIIIAALSVGSYSVLKNNRAFERSLAVLPLQNLTGDAGNDYLVDGFHDALIGELGQIGSLRVISRTSTLSYRNTNKLLPDIARELEVNTIVEGTVVKAGDSIRVYIQLLDPFPRERHLLAKEYRNDMQNILTVQSLVAKDISQKIRVSLSREEQMLISRPRTVDPETYKNYLRGMFHFNQGTAASFETGMEYMYKAIEQDPGDPFAYAGLALALAIKGHGMISPAESFRSAEAAAERAIKIDPTIDEAYTALALIYLYQYWDWPKAKSAFQDAIDRNPNNAIAHAHFTYYHFLVGDREQTLYHAKTAVVLEPLSASYRAWLAMLYFHYGELEKAEAAAGKALELEPGIPYGNLVMGWVFLQNEQYQEAIGLHQKLPEYQDYYKMFIGYTYVKSGQREKALAIWNEWEEYAADNWVNPFHRGLLAGMLGFHDQAFELLNEAVDKKYYPMPFLNIFPGVEFLKDDPRYHLLFLKLGLPYEGPEIASRVTKG